MSVGVNTTVSVFVPAGSTVPFVGEYTFVPPMLSTASFWFVPSGVP